MFVFALAVLVAYQSSIGRTPVTSPDAPSVLNLSLSQVAVSIQAGHGVYFSATLTNTLQRVANVSSSDGWAAPQLVSKFCGVPTYPLSVVVIQGYYAEENISKAPALESPAMSCTTQGEGQRYYAFNAGSDNATISGCDPQKSLCEISVSRSGVFSGYWQGGQMQPFSPGKYSVVAEDEWGHLSLASFIVVPG